MRFYPAVGLETTYLQVDLNCGCVPAVRLVTTPSNLFCPYKMSWLVRTFSDSDKSIASCSSDRSVRNMSVKNASSIYFEETFSMHKPVHSNKLEANLSKNTQVYNALSTSDLVFSYQTKCVTVLEANDNFQIDKELLRREIALPKNKIKKERYFENVDRPFRLKIREV